MYLSWRNATRKNKTNQQVSACLSESLDQVSLTRPAHVRQSNHSIVSPCTPPGGFPPFPSAGGVSPSISALPGIHCGSCSGRLGAAILLYLAPEPVLRLMCSRGGAEGAYELAVHSGSLSLRNQLLASWSFLGGGGWGGGGVLSWRVRWLFGGSILG